MSAQIGELFSRAYIERGAAAQDSAAFRHRLDAYLSAEHTSEHHRIATFLRREAGYVVRSWSFGTGGLGYHFTAFFTEEPIATVLSSITLIYRYLSVAHRQLASPGRGVPSVYVSPQAESWRVFVERAMREENTAYRLDAACGVHFFVDQEFEQNRASTIAALQAPRYNGARTAFEAAHAYLDSTPSDTKAAVRAAFESLEIVARLMVVEAQNLNGWMVENRLLPLALAAASDATEQRAMIHIFASLADFVNAIHLYRHGQGAEEPVAPPLTFAVYAVSTVASALRLFVSVDASSPS